MSEIGTKIKATFMAIGQKTESGNFMFRKVLTLRWDANPDNDAHPIKDGITLLCLSTMLFL